jgi:hypothetical protein
MGTPSRVRSRRASAVAVIVGAAISLAGLTAQTVGAVADRTPAVDLAASMPVPARLTVVPAGLDNETTTTPPQGSPTPTSTDPPSSSDIPSSSEVPSSTDTPSSTEIPTSTETPESTEAPRYTTERPPTSWSPQLTSPRPTNHLATTSPPPPTVTGTPVPINDESSPYEFALPLILLACAILVGAALLAYTAHRRRSPKWVRTQVRVVPRHGATATFDTRPTDESGRDHVLTVVTAELGRSIVVEEDPS